MFQTDMMSKGTFRSVSLLALLDGTIEFPFNIFGVSSLPFDLIIVVDCLLTLVKEILFFGCKFMQGCFFG